MKSLRNANVIGFFSLPSPSLAEHNPSAYYAALANAPEGAGSCSHCGTGILHHVVIKDDEGVLRFIGSECALKVGADSESIRYRLTTQQLEARNQKRAAEFDAYRQRQQAAEDAHAQLLASRREKIGYIADMLRSHEGNEFYQSLADQLEVRPLSSRQAEYVAKATSATGRRNKKNAEAFDAVWDACTEA
jgi:hypothetical protein